VTTCGVWNCYSNLATMRVDIACCAEERRTKRQKANMAIANESINKAWNYATYRFIM
jgi:hypothetical protein